MSTQGERTYKEFNIKFNETPRNQSNFSGGFGWAFQVDSSAGHAFSVVIKSLAEPTSENLNQALEIAYTEVRRLIDGGKRDKEYLCYDWDPGDDKLAEVDCDDISPKEYR